MELLLLLWLAQDKYATAASKIDIPDGSEWAKESKQHAVIVKTFSDRAAWAAALKSVDEKLGLFREEVAFKVVWTSLADVKHPARITTGDGVTTMEVNFAVLVPYQQTLEENEKQMREAKAKGKIVKNVLPPITLEATMAHEAVHYFQQTGKIEKGADWFVEGMAAFVEPNDAHIRYFVYDKKAVGKLDAPLETGDVYARGWLFFSWAEERLGKAKLREFVTRTIEGGDELEKTAAELFGKEWGKLLDMEKSWAESKVKAIRKAMAP